MRRLFAVAVLAGLGCAAQPAEASLISPIDPIIGVRGDRTGSPDVTDGSVYPLSPCADAVLAGFFCAPYQNNVEVITSIDLSFWDVNGLPIPNVFFTPETDGPQPNYFASDLSDLEALLNGNDLFTVRLCDASNTAGQAACNPDFNPPVLFALTSFLDGPSFFSFPSFFVFSNVGGFVSVRGVNTIPNPDLPPNNLPLNVPEPAAVSLLGIGVAMAAARRRAARRAV